MLLPCLKPYKVTLASMTQLVGVSSCTLKGHGFEGSGHIPGLHVQSLVGVHIGVNQSMLLSYINVSFSLFLPLPLKSINIYICILKTYKYFLSDPGEKPKSLSSPMRPCSIWPIVAVTSSPSPSPLLWPHWATSMLLPQGFDTWHPSAPSALSLALAGWLSWSEHHPDTPRLWVPSQVRAHTRINQWMQK